MRKSVWIGGAVVVAAAVAAVVLWPEKPVKVAVAEVGRGTVEQVVANTRAGTVNACRRSKLSMPMGGRVERLHVKEGDRVPAGAVLLEIWNDDRAAQLAQARSVLKGAGDQERQVCVSAEQSGRDAQHVSELAKQQLVAGDAVDQANTKRSAANAGCSAAQSQTASARDAVKVQEALFEQTRLRAPFAGIVAEVNGEIGEYVTPSPPGVATPPAVDLIDDSCLYVTAPIDEVDAAQVKTTLPARIALDAFRGRDFPGKVSRIAPYVIDKEKQARTVDVEVRFDAPPKDINLLAGYSADVEIILARRDDVVRIPAEALVDGNAVLVLNPDSKKLEKRAVKTGLSNWSWIEVAEGLQGGEKVVTSLDRTGVSEGITAEAEVDTEAENSQAAQSQATKK